MNPAFDPFNPMDPRTPERPTPAGGSGLPYQYTVGGHPSQTPPPAGGSPPSAANQPGGTAGGSGLAATIAAGTGGTSGAPAWYHFAGQAPGPPPVSASRLAAVANWDPAMHPGRARPTIATYRPGHDFGPGMDWSKYYNAGNMGQSAPGGQTIAGTGIGNPGPGATSEYWWMSDPSVQWGGGPHGYLPIDYQPQSYDYYANAPGRLAPWESKYMQDTWTQNYDPTKAGYIDTGHPENWGNVRG